MSEKRHVCFQLNALSVFASFSADSEQEQPVERTCVDCDVFSLIHSADIGGHLSNRRTKPVRIPKRDPQ